jgi:hypothetical protein
MSATSRVAARLVPSHRCVALAALAFALLRGLLAADHRPCCRARVECASGSTREGIGNDRLVGLQAPSVASTKWVSTHRNTVERHDLKHLRVDQMWKSVGAPCEIEHLRLLPVESADCPTGGPRTRTWFSARSRPVLSRRDNRRHVVTRPMGRQSIGCRTSAMPLGEEARPPQCAVTL